MRRHDLPELEDSPRCPRWLRDALTGYLQVVLAVTRPYAAVAPRLAGLLRESRCEQVLDLASGGGGPWPALLEQLAAEGLRPRVELTDVAPNTAAAERLEQLEGVVYRRTPLAAPAVPAAEPGVRTMFTALHHFDRAQVRAILLAAQQARTPFLAAEATHRSARGVLVTLFIPLLVLLLMPRVRPRRPLPLLLTYLPPVLPLVIWWDGLASTLRTWHAAELRALVQEIATPGYAWSVEELAVRGAPIPVTLVVGRPGQ